jgi:hypothetical protein
VRAETHRSGWLHKGDESERDLCALKLIAPVALLVSGVRL